MCAVCGMPFESPEFLKKTVDKYLPNSNYKIGTERKALYHTADHKFEFCGPAHASEWFTKNAYGHDLASAVQNHNVEILEKL